LLEYTTKEKDIQKGISRVPLPLSRLTDEDLVNLDQFRRNTPTTADSSDTSSEKTLTAKMIYDSRAYSVTGQPQI
jgi:hypothetical protein